MQAIFQGMFMTVGCGLLWRLGWLLRHTERRGVRAVLHGLMGLAALLMGNAAGSLFGLGLGLNGFTLPVSAVLGVPGVALMWAVRYLI